MSQHIADAAVFFRLLLDPSLQCCHFQKGVLQLHGSNVGVLQALPVDRGHLANADSL